MTSHNKPTKLKVSIDFQLQQNEKTLNTNNTATTADMNQRWRCLTVGCNPRLNGHTAIKHKEDTGHRTAKWPVRSAAGKAKQRIRNKTGYYDKYNVGYKSRSYQFRDEDYCAGYDEEYFG